MSQIVIVLVTAIVVAAITWYISGEVRKRRDEAKIGGADERAREIIDDA